MDRPTAAQLYSVFSPKTSAPVLEPSLRVAPVLEPSLRVAPVLELSLQVACPAPSPLGPVSPIFEMSLHILILEVLVAEGVGLIHYWRRRTGTIWHRGVTITNNAAEQGRNV